MTTEEEPRDRGRRRALAMHRLLRRLYRAADRGTGSHLTAEEVDALANGSMGEAMAAAAEMTEADVLAEEERAWLGLGSGLDLH